MWCPKCRVEYRDGITICADCGTPLVEGSEEDFDVVDICSVKDEAMADQFMDYLVYSKLEGAKKQFDEESGIYTVTVPTALEKKAERLFEGYMKATAEEAERKKLEEISAKQQAERGEDASDSEPEETDDTESESDSVLDEEKEETSGELEEYDWDAEEEDEPEADPFADEEDVELGGNEEEDDMPETILYEPAKEYVKKEDAYKDMLFSGWTFIIFGVAGLVYLLLCKLDVIPINYNIVVFACITAMFVFFCIGGIVSVVRSGRLKSQIPIEEKKTREIKEWLQENLTEEIIRSWFDKKVTEAENDLLIMAHIRSSLLKQYPEEEISYLEMISEEYYTEYIQDADVFANEGEYVEEDDDEEEVK